mgnify:CR=1 FL=1
MRKKNCNFFFVKFFREKLDKMTSIVKFQSLSGVDDESPHCYMLQIDDFKEIFEKQKRHIPKKNLNSKSKPEIETRNRNLKLETRYRN